ncbi:beta-galactosidase [Paraburkholderia tropica]|uniref:Beta-galactosidase n=1 Tax=Paraburkholderia tropica TaxID=92647 RepID=A0A1A5XGR4_9BURK|nr:MULTISPECIES: beta-galactosidase [Paraburkholderia]MBB2983656.1 beta-galactosidase [Paraburkholderia tropica]OBR52671.1 beta-galactosidase [Paraburkholderia tropica]RQM46484.1 beta-galactosidase [Paraburkholderia bannensis]RQN35108.1 beta-galactosidase [Paraburkholderia tropica]SEK11990.1 beta-galactosidase [Paraburkholderia tropica]
MQIGVCYYPEQWPRTMWADDARRMAELGISHVRIAEFAWSRMEPRKGVFDWTWLDEAIETLAARGLKLVLGTPTASPPKWLVDSIPDMLPVRADGTRWNYGSRRHYDIASVAYRKECERITEAMAQRYGRHPAVVAWQTDNELGCHDTVPSYSAAAQQRFQAWLAQRYGSIEALNEAWGNVFWSMEYPSFETVGLPVLTPTDANPSHLLDFRRYMSDEVASFHREQAEVLRRHAPDADVLHNFMGFFTTFDHYEFAANNAIDVATWDSYPIARTEVIGVPEADKARYARTAHPDVSAFDHDRYRAIGAGRFWVMEQQAGPVNWAPWNPVPAKGMVRLWAYEAFAHGAELVSYFRWRQCPYAQEQMHSGLNLPNNELSPGGEEVAQAAREIALSETLRTLGAPAPAAVALVFDYETQWMFEIQRHGVGFDYQTLAFDYYSALREQGLDVDIVSRHADLSAYRLVVVPSLAVLDDAFIAKVEQSDARWLFGPRTGSKTTHFAIPGNLPPGPLQRVLPLQVLEAESLRPTLAPALSLGDVSGAALHWREHVRANEGAQVDATFEDGWPALLSSGRVQYATAWLTHDLHRALLGAAARAAGLDTQTLPEGVRLARRGGLSFAFNFGEARVRAPAPEGAQFVLGAPELARGDVCAWRDPR